MIAPEKYIQIVLADDDEDDRDLFEMAVKELSIPISVRLIINGQELLRYLAENKIPDILFLDLNMPMKSGFECLEAIRNNEKLKNLPVIILSTSNAKRDIDKCFDLKANFYIVKPFSYQELSNVIKKILDKEWKDNFVSPPRNKFVYKGY
jgi:CheY-like chemotaxis protein